CTSRFRGATTAKTTWSNRRTSGTVIVVPGFFSQPAFLQHQKPQRQHHQRHVVVPTAPAPHLIFIQSHFVLAPQETVFDRPARVPDLHQGQQRTIPLGV